MNLKTTTTVKRGLVRYFLLLPALLLLSLMPLEPLQACGGTPAPPCGRSVFLAKFTPGVVVVPAAGPINVPIGVLPFAIWNPGGVPPVCPQPAAASLTLTLTCFPSGIVIGPQAFAVPVPTVPGPQPVPGGLVNFVIPAGVFPAGSPPQICTVVGTYTLTFSDGVVLNFTGDTEVCLVPPSPLAADKPRLELSYLPLQPDEWYRSCRKGDQANLYFLLANNDPDETVALNLSSIGRQVAQLPDGISQQDAYAMDVFAISQPDEGTDTYPAAFTDELMPGELLPEPDPMTPDPQMLSRNIMLGPLEAIIIGITMRSFGMCANGSCNERLLTVEGLFSDGDDALACASTLLVVDEMPPKSILCEFVDEVKTTTPGQAIWGPANFGTLSGPIPHAQSLFAGNLPPPTIGYLTVAGDFLLPETGMDYIRLDQPAAGVSYAVNFSSQVCNAEGAVNFVQVVGLDVTEQESISLPVIGLDIGTTAPLNVLYDAFSDLLILSIGEEVIFEGTGGQFFAEPPTNFCVDAGSCRTFTKRFSFGGGAKTIHVIPPALARLFLNQNDDPGCDNFQVLTDANMPADWTASVDGDQLMLPATMGSGTLENCYQDIGDLPLVPETTIGFIDVDCPGALNSPLRVPVALRLAMVVGTSEPGVSWAFQPAAPNPFGTHTRLQYRLTEPATVSFAVYDYQGRSMQMFAPPQRQPSGDHSWSWDGRNDSGIRLPPGVYFVHIRINSEETVEKLVLQ